jgi:CRP-like cAMP-binding protein
MKDFLGQVGLFEGLDEAELERIARRLKRHSVPAGRTIIQENEPADRCWILLSGSARVSSSLAGSDSLYSLLNPGDHFGEISLIDGQAPSATVTTEAASELLSISHDDLKQFIESDPSIAAKLLHSMLRGLCRRLRETDQSLAFARFMTRPDGA